MAFRIAIVSMLVGAGWVAGRAQAPRKRGCELVWAERGINPNAARMPTFTFQCSGKVARCSSATIGGWVK
jgi:hypothetical protein